MTFVTPAITEGMLAGAGSAGGTGAGTGLLGGGSATAGMSSLDAIAASQPGYVANGAGLDAVSASLPNYTPDGAALANLKVGSALGAAGKAGANYNTVNKAMGGEQPQRRAPQGRPIFQGEPAPIAPAASAPRNNNAVLAAIARQRQRGF